MWDVADLSLRAKQRLLGLRQRRPASAPREGSGEAQRRRSRRRPPGALPSKEWETGMPTCGSSAMPCSNAYSESSVGFGNLVVRVVVLAKTPTLARTPTPALTLALTLTPALTSDTGADSDTGTDSDSDTGTDSGAGSGHGLRHHRLSIHRGNGPSPARRRIRLRRPLRLLQAAPYRAPSSSGGTVSRPPPLQGAMEYTSSGGTEESVHRQ